MSNQSDHSQDSPMTPSSQHKAHPAIESCPLCSTEYSEDRIRVIDQVAESELLHISCSACDNAMLAVVVHTPAGVSSVGMVTDLTMLDAITMRSAEPISLEDVLAFHEVLEQGKHTIYQTNETR